MVELTWFSELSPHSPSLQYAPRWRLWRLIKERACAVRLCARLALFALHAAFSLLLRAFFSRRCAQHVSRSPCLSPQHDFRLIAAIHLLAAARFSLRTVCISFRLLLASSLSSGLCARHCSRRSPFRASSSRLCLSSRLILCLAFSALVSSQYYTTLHYVVLFN